MFLLIIHLHHALLQWQWVGLNVEILEHNILGISLRHKANMGRVRFGLVIFLYACSSCFNSERNILGTKSSYPHTW